MAKKVKKVKLKKNDQVLVIDLKDKEPGKRQAHKAVIDKIKSKSGKKIKTDKGNEDFDEDGNAESGDETRILIPLTQERIAILLRSGYINILDDISSITFDDARLKRWESEDNE